jgi:hypothetical protein
MLRRVALVRTDVSEELSAFIMVTRIGELGTTLAVTSNQSSVLVLRKIWGFHGSDYEEWRHLWYKTPVRTSQEKHYVSATEPSLLMLCKIWDFHGGVYEECRFLGCCVAWIL